ncbi:exonuclease domain-containing protein [Phaeacidiphilus oryzae]|uniref:exonuclease domain-containing protein n=1 Tax=Phaeacidiphilus oryzae TaxID=348818 RepID=UPI0005692960|nr:exonuclease domain-containing protein [Phaeacidiphilus oryzae]
MTWADGVLVGFDLETTGTDPATSRIVTAALVKTKGGEPVGTPGAWVVDPGIPVPAEAAAIHGYTTERVRAEGRPPAEAVDEIAAALCGHLADGVPVVVFNAPFDLSLLEAELARYGLASLAERLSARRGALPGGAPALIGPVIDPLVLDRRLDRYRRGSRTLGSVCAAYGVVFAAADAHQAGGDALAAVRVAVALARRHAGQLDGVDAELLHRHQVGWHAEWAADFEGWLRRGREPGATIPRDWPLRAG